MEIERENALVLFAASLAWTMGTGDGWACLTDEGFGLFISPVKGGVAWDWSASSRWMTAVGRGGQEQTRLAAAVAGLRALLNAGHSISELKRC